MPEGSPGNKDNSTGTKSSEPLAASSQHRLLETKPDREDPIPDGSIKSYDRWLLATTRRLFREPKIYNYDLAHLDFLLRRGASEDKDYVYQYTGDLLAKVPREPLDQQSDPLPEISQEELTKGLNRIKILSLNTFLAILNQNKKKKFWR